MAYTEMALKTSQDFMKTYCIKCSCMGDFKTDDGEYFIMSGTEKLEPKALTADRVCHCATCFEGCETIHERTERICFHQIKTELLKNGFEAAKKADESLDELGADWANPSVQAVVVEAEQAIANTVNSIMYG
jgi:hypothetical protein